MDDSFVVVVVNRFDAEKFVSLDWAVDAKIPHGAYTVQVHCCQLAEISATIHLRALPFTFQMLRC
jgi:hypothetical protein